METSSAILDWLLGGDPAIRWQTQRDLLGVQSKVYEAERTRVAVEGWGADLLSRQDPSGTWGGGLYSPKWISTTYTLLLLRHLGLSPDNPQAQRGCSLFLAKGIHHDGGINLFHTIDYSETCINGMLLALLSYFRCPDERVHAVASFLLKVQMADGGWNCEWVKGATHSSFHTTISVLEGLAEYRLTYPTQGTRTLPASQRAHEFLLQHRLYRSHHTGEVVDPAMTRMNFPPRWKYDFIRVLDYFQWIGAQRDERMNDAIDLLRDKQKADERWPAYSLYSGRKFFEMEKAGEASRWNTLRALRVMKWWNTKA